MTEKHALLDLDEIFGVAHKLEVHYRGKAYELMLPDDIGPLAFVKYGRIRACMRGLGEAKEEDGEEAAKKIEGVVRNVLALLSPGLAEQNLSIPAAIRVLQFYNEEAGKPALPEETPPQAGGKSPETPSRRRRRAAQSRKAVRHA
ncbi:MAG: hypothetical protein ABSB61_04880 [Anaerolineales bacterium]|jgi:hypothetical protein